jgi:ribosomal protein S18 acetylase RimI-like enzyme
MTGGDIEVRRFAAEDAESFREIRLEALRTTPEAFGSTFEAEEGHGLEWFAERMNNGNMFGAFLEGRVVGMVGLLVEKGLKEAHKGMLVSMYVRPEARRHGIGRLLVEAVIEFARGRVELVRLAVVSDNESARRLYEQTGFVEYGFEKKSLKQNGRYYDEVLMMKDL